MSSYYLPHPGGGGNGWKCQNYESEGCDIKLTYTPDTSRTLRTKQTENIIMETNELILALNHSFLPAEINECHPQYYRDGLTLNHSEMANMYQQSGPE